MVKRKESGSEGLYNLNHADEHDVFPFPLGGDTRVKLYGMTKGL